MAILGLVILVLAIWVMVTLSGSKKQLVEQTTILRNANPAPKHWKYGITSDGDNYLFEGKSYPTLQEAVTIAEQTIMGKYGITQEGDKFRFGEYSYEKLADAIGYAEKRAWKNRSY
jgi:hypothetical protein